MLAYLELDLSLSNVLLAAVAADNLLSLSDLVPHSLSTVSLGVCAHLVAMLTSALKSSMGKPSTALMLSWEPGWTTAKPPDTVSVSAPAI